MTLFDPHRSLAEVDYSKDDALGHVCHKYTHVDLQGLADRLILHGHADGWPIVPVGKVIMS